MPQKLGGEDARIAERNLVEMNASLHQEVGR
jgi:hypothetical protein